MGEKLKGKKKQQLCYAVESILLDWFGSMYPLKADLYFLLTARTQNGCRANPVVIWHVACARLQKLTRLHGTIPT